MFDQLSIPKKNDKSAYNFFHGALNYRQNQFILEKKNKTRQNAVNLNTGQHTLIIFF